MVGNAVLSTGAIFCQRWIIRWCILSQKFVPTILVWINQLLRKNFRKSLQQFFENKNSSRTGVVSSRLTPKTMCRMKRIAGPPEVLHSPKKLWLEDDPFLEGPGNFSWENEHSLNLVGVPLGGSELLCRKWGSYHIYCKYAYIYISRYVRHLLYTIGWIYPTQDAGNTTRIVTFVVGNPCKPSVKSLRIVGGVDPNHRGKGHWVNLADLTYLPQK